MNCFNHTRFLIDLPSHFKGLLEKLPPLADIVQAIAHEGGRALLVGGAVRDFVMHEMASMCDHKNNKSLDTKNPDIKDHDIKNIETKSRDIKNFKPKNFDIKDLDIEVHGLTSDQLESILSRFGIVDQVGKSFGVFKFLSNPFTVQSSDLSNSSISLASPVSTLSPISPLSPLSTTSPVSIDWSLPRTDGSGRKPEVTVNPRLSLRDAFMRRDFTMNAMGIDLHTYEFIDLFDGFSDIQKHVLRSPNIEFFVEDPLRFYRTMQFIGRFDMEPDAALNNVCSSMDISTVSIERIEQEVHKLLLKSDSPSRGFRWLSKIGRLKELFPELDATQYTLQDPGWHPEGNVFEHSMQTLDAAAFIVRSNDFRDLENLENSRNFKASPDSELSQNLNKDLTQDFVSQDSGSLNKDMQLTFLYAALCHDLGKVPTTKNIDGRWRAHGHDVAGVKLTVSMLSRVIGKKDLIAAVSKLVRYHMMPVLFVAENAGSAAYKRLAHALFPTITLKMLALLSLADQRGRNPVKSQPLPDAINNSTDLCSDTSTGICDDSNNTIDTFLDNARKAGVLETREKPILMGADLLDQVPPGKRLGELLRYAYQLQIEEGICDREELKRRVLEHENK